MPFLLVVEGVRRLYRLSFNKSGTVLGRITVLVRHYVCMKCCALLELKAVPPRRVRSLFLLCE